MFSKFSEIAQKLLMFVHLREEKMIFVESNGLYEALKSKTSFIVDFYTTDQDIKLQSKIIIIKLKVKSRYINIVLAANTTTWLRSLAEKKLASMSKLI